MALLINNTHPQFRVYNPETGGYAQFQMGRLEIDEGDPDYAVVMAEGQRNPFITIVVSATFCPRCGIPFEGKGAKKDLEEHVKESHFDTWLADVQAAQANEQIALVKANAGIACDICQPVQVFGDAGLLAIHAKVVHASGEEEATAPKRSRRPGEVD